VLGVVVDHRDEPDREGHRRVPVLVDHAGEVGVLEGVQVGERLLVHGVVVLGEQLGRHRGERRDLGGLHPVAVRLGRERQAGALVEAAGDPDLLAAGERREVVVLHPGQVPDEPGGGVGLRVGAEAEPLGGAVLEDGVHGPVHPVEGVAEEVDGCSHPASLLGAAAPRHPPRRARRIPGGGCRILAP
jgi:hypothetical protein